MMSYVVLKPPYSLLLTEYMYSLVEKNLLSIRVSTTELRAQVNVRKTQSILNTHTLHRNAGRRDCPHNLCGKALEGTVTEIPANPCTLNIKSINENTLIKANFS